jgi:hypothetical protein
MCIFRKLALCSKAMSIMFYMSKCSFALNAWQHLYNSFEEVLGVFQFATAITSNDLEEIQKFLDTAVNSR